MMTEATTIVTIIGGIIAAYKVFTESILNWTSRKKDELKFAASLIESCDNKEHPLVIELHYNALFKKTLSSDEICHLINWDSPTTTFKTYHLSRKCIEYNPEYDHLDFSSRFKKASHRKWTKVINIIGYGIYALIALSPLFFLSSLLEKGVQIKTIFIVFLVMSLSFGYLAYTMVREYWQIKFAEELVEKSKRYSKYNNQVSKDAGANAPPSVT